MSNQITFLICKTVFGQTDTSSEMCSRLSLGGDALRRTLSAVLTFDIPRTRGTGNRNTKISETRGDLPRIPPTHTCMSLSTPPTREGHFLQLMNLHWRGICPKSRVYIRCCAFCGFVQWHIPTITFTQSSFTALLILCAPPTHTNNT